MKKKTPIIPNCPKVIHFDLLNPDRAPDFVNPNGKTGNKYPIIFSNGFQGIFTFSCEITSLCYCFSFEPKGPISSSSIPASSFVITANNNFNPSHEHIFTIHILNAEENASTDVLNKKKENGPTYHITLSVVSQHSIFNLIDERKSELINNLREAVRIPSISCYDDSPRKPITEILDFFEKKLKSFGATCEITNLNNKPFFPILFAKLGKDKAKKTLLVYGHLDVLPANEKDGWNSNPFMLVENMNKLYGRGCSDAKGPIMAFMNAIECIQELKVDIPLNVKFIFETNKHGGSKGLDEVLQKRKNTFLSDVDFTCMSDNFWLDENKPCLVYLLRGYCSFRIEVKTCEQKIHSSFFCKHQASDDIKFYFQNLCKNDDEKISISEINKKAFELTDKEKSMYSNINIPKFPGHVSKEEFIKKLNQPLIKFEPTNHPQYGAPAKIYGNFSILSVPGINSAELYCVLSTKLKELWKERGTCHTVRLEAYEAFDSWTENFENDHFKIAKAAIRKVFNIQPHLIRGVGCLSTTRAIKTLTQKNLVIIPIGNFNDRANGVNENIDTNNYLTGSKLFTVYMLMLGGLLKD